MKNCSLLILVFLNLVFGKPMLISNDCVFLFHKQSIDYKNSSNPTPIKKFKTFLDDFFYDLGKNYVSSPDSYIPLE